MKHFKFSRKLASNIILLHEKHLQCKCTGIYSHVFGIFRILKKNRATLIEIEGLFGAETRVKVEKYLAQLVANMESFFCSDEEEIFNNINDILENAR